MTAVVFVAPFFAETTVRFVDAAARCEGVRLGLVSQDPLQRLPRRVRALLSAHARLKDGLDAAQIAAAVRQVAPQLGGCDRIIGVPWNCG